MKIRSKALYTYLFEAGVLNGTPEEIDHAKREYRRLYKKRWKQQKRPRKEIRIEFTLKQFQGIKMKAREFDLRHTTYGRQVILAAVEVDLSFIPHREKLEQILQLVSMAAIASFKGTATIKELSVRLMRAETKLLNYLQYAP